ncbi:MAG TPA: hypothetical protein VFA59_04710 [Vicinamibacterales bacterium]|nr:hypothetical protein [Vicinamibacterales bacterium]
MLRIEIQQLANGVRIDLHGTLGGEWVPLVEQHWRSIVDGVEPAPTVTIGLSDVDFIDASGARLLRRMAEAGSEFVVAGCMNRYVVDTLRPHVNASKGEAEMATYEDRIAAKIHEINEQIDRFDAIAKSKRTQAEIAAIEGLKNAKTGLDSALVKVEKALEDFRQKYTTTAAAKE